MVLGFVSTAAGAVLGVALGLAGAALGFPTPMAFALAGIVAGVIGLRELATGRRMRLLQFDRETPRTWDDGSLLSWAVKTGIAVGTGLYTRIGFTLWYIIPGAALLSGRAGFGAELMGVYGATRGFATMLFNRQLCTVGWPTLRARWLVVRSPARRVSGACTLVVAAITIGLNLSPLFTGDVSSSFFVGPEHVRTGGSCDSGGTAGRGVRLMGCERCRQ